jgi:IS30 family transposase
MKKLTPKQIEKIKALHVKGLSERAIALKIKRARSTVWYQLQKIK